MSNDDFSEMKTRVHILQQTGKKGACLYFKSCSLHTGNLSEEAVCNIALVHRGKAIHVLYELMNGVKT